MKGIKNRLTTFIALLCSTFLSVAAFAQEKTNVDISLNKDSDSNWYAQPWVWIVGGAVFILLLVALLRGNRSKD